MRFDYCEECDTQHVDQCYCDHNQWYWDELEQDCNPEPEPDNVVELSYYRFYKSLKKAGAPVRWKNGSIV